jgi:3'-phosphoadenosine 5'-phosphosulfate sulfotransferase (PAPS reductase)/FAD synthetase
VKYWLSYGVGVNSTALMVAVVTKQLVLDAPLRIVFADTQDEKDETYTYLFTHAMPYARRHGLTIEVVRPDEGVLQRFERLQVTGSRIVRSCSAEAKIKPITKHIRAHGTPQDVQLIGIHAGEQGRSRKASKPGELPRRYPLIELDWDQEDCEEAIVAAGLPVPVKSGCWHCPFMRVREIITLAISAPDKFGRIVRLEDAATAKHGPDPTGGPRTHWGDRPTREWAARACAVKAAGADAGERVVMEHPLFDERNPPPPCECFDGEGHSAPKREATA